MHCTGRLTGRLGCKYSYFLSLLIFSLGFSPAGQGQSVSAGADTGFGFPEAFLLPAAFKNRLSDSTHWRIQFLPLDIPASGISFTFWLDSKDFLPVSFAELPDNCLYSSSVSASCTLEPDKNIQFTVAAESLFPALAIWHSARDPQQQPVRALISVTPLSLGDKTPEFIDWQSRPEAVHELEQLHLRLQRLSKGDNDPLPNIDEFETYARAQHNFNNKNSKTGQLLEIPPDAWFRIRLPGQSSTLMDYGEPVDMDNPPPAKQESSDRSPPDKKSTERQPDREQHTGSTQSSPPQKAGTATSRAAKMQDTVSSGYPGPGLLGKVNITGTGNIPAQMPPPLHSVTEAVNRLPSSVSRLGSLMRSMYSGAVKVFNNFKCLPLWVMKSSPIRRLAGLTGLTVAALYFNNKMRSRGLPFGFKRRFLTGSGIKGGSGISVMVLPPSLGDLCLTGFNYDGKHIVTVNHILSLIHLPFSEIKNKDRAPPLIHCCSEKGKFRARKLGSDRKNDLAVYRIEGNETYFDKSFLELPEADQDKSWGISFARTLSVTGLDCDKFEMASVKSYCIANLVTPTRYYCIGYLNTKEGYSGSPAILEKNSKLMTVGMLSSGMELIPTGKDFANQYIRTRKIHEIVQDIIKNSPVD